MKVRTAHVSLEFRDSDKQHTHDIEKIFARAVKRKYAWLTGTEAGPGAGNTGDELLRVARENGYRPWVPAEQGSGPGIFTDCWIAVREDLITGAWKPAYEPVIPGSQKLYDEAKRPSRGFPKWGPKGVVSVTFKSTPELGEIGIASAHHLTKAKKPGKDAVINGVDHWAWNEKLDEALGEWMKEAGAGKALAFAGMDRNASLRRSGIDIPGAKAAAAELKKWRNTGHGDIDWIVSYKKDKRVEATQYIVLNDRAFFLHTDHFLVEATYEIEPLKV